MTWRYFEALRPGDTFVFASRRRPRTWDDVELVTVPPLGTPLTSSTGEVIERSNFPWGEVPVLSPNYIDRTRQVISDIRQFFADNPDEVAANVVGWELEGSRWDTWGVERGNGWSRIPWDHPYVARLTVEKVPPTCPTCRTYITDTNPALGDECCQACGQELFDGRFIYRYDAVTARDAHGTDHVVGPDQWFRCRVTGSTFVRDDVVGLDGVASATLTVTNQYGETDYVTVRADRADGAIETCGGCDQQYLTGQRHRCAHAQINGYGYRPDPNFLGEGPLFLGVELETECEGSWTVDQGVAWVAKHSDKGRICYLKSDGSIRNGFEIVTHPMSLEWAMESFPWEMLDGLRSNGFRSWTTTTCGLHVHMSRDAFAGDTHLLAFMLFAYRVKAKLIKLAGRNSHWSSWEADGDDYSIEQKAKGDSGSTRYTAINTSNTATVEMRFWKGSLNPIQVKAAIQWCHAAWEFTRDITDPTAQGALSWDAFVSWVSERSDRFPELELRIAERAPGAVISAALAEAVAEVEHGWSADYDSTVRGDEDNEEDEDEDEDECGCWSCRHPDDNDDEEDEDVW